MSVKAVEVSTKDLLRLQEAIDSDASICEISVLLKKSRLYYSSEQGFMLPTLLVFQRVLQKYIIDKK